LEIFETRMTMSVLELPTTRILITVRARLSAFPRSPGASPRPFRRPPEAVLSPA
jgi:hypothetical protein